MARDAEHDAGQPLIAHLTELRDRLLRCLVVVLALTLLLLPFANDIYVYVAEPMQRYLPEGGGMIATEVASPFLTPFKLVIVAAFCLAMPYVLHQTWAFIAPGMYQREKRLAGPLLGSSIALFYAGLAFAYFLVFPLVFGFFSAIVPAGVAYTPDIARFLDMALKLFLAFGIAFEIPVATVLLIWSGAVDARSLAAKRPYVLLGCFAVSMLLTPPDVFSQVMLALPMWLLFEAGLIFSRLRPAGAAARHDSED